MVASSAAIDLLVYYLIVAHQSANSTGQPKTFFPCRAQLLCQGNPNFHPARAGLGIELFAVAFEARFIGRIQSRLGHPAMPYFIECIADGRYMVAVREDRVFSSVKIHGCKFRR